MLEITNEKKKLQEELMEKRNKEIEQQYDKKNKVEQEMAKIDEDIAFL